MRDIEKEEFWQEFSDRLLKAADSTGKSQSKICMECGLNVGMISNLTNPRTKYIPTAYTLAHLCKGLNVSADWLLFGDDKEE